MSEFTVADTCTLCVLSALAQSCSMSLIVYMSCHLEDLCVCVCEACSAVAEELNKKNGWDMRIHVDAASGGFVAPFIYPDLEFDFRLKNVNSVSASGHKYGCTGLLYAALSAVRDHCCYHADIALLSRCYNAMMQSLHHHAGTAPRP